MLVYFLLSLSLLFISAFSYIKIIKCPFTMTDYLLEAILEMATSSYCSDNGTLVKSIQCK